MKIDVLRVADIEKKITKNKHNVGYLFQNAFINETYLDKQVVNIFASEKFVHV